MGGGSMTGNGAENMPKKSGKTCAVSTAQKATSRFQALRDYGIRGAGVRSSRTSLILSICVPSSRMMRLLSVS